MLLLLDCSKCMAVLYVRADATSIGCAVCHSVTHFTDHRSLPPPLRQQQRGSCLKPRVPRQVGPAGGVRKKAVICGITYKRSPGDRLKGCINDAKSMQELLIHRFKFPKNQILLLTEQERDPYRIPTKQNIRMAMDWLVAGCRAGDSLVFYFSGHGDQQKDDDGDEVDGFDETLCPLDYSTNGVIVDDEINDTLVRPIPRGAKLTAIIDACHSGTMLDLPYLCKMYRRGQYEWKDHRPRNGIWKGTSGGEVISFSGCTDNQTSADSTPFSKVITKGAMTYAFIQAIERGYASTYGCLLNAMHHAIHNPNKCDFGNELLLTRGIILTGYKQDPQLSANEPFDIHTTPFTL